MRLVIPSCILGCRCAGRQKPDTKTGVSRSQSKTHTVGYQLPVACAWSIHTVPSRDKLGIGTQWSNLQRC